jgi:pimeloyl-ACP methyl ester carboxylesterase
VDYLETRPEVDSKRIGGYGFSSGGTALLEAALEEPRIKTLVTQDATTYNSLPWIGKVIIKFLCWIGGIKRGLTGKEIRIPLGFFAKLVPLLYDSEINQKWNAEIWKRGHYWALPGGEAAFFVDTILRVGKIRQPTLVLWGEEDQVDPVKSAHILFEALTCEKELAIIGGNGHAGHLDRNRQQVFERCAEWLLKYLPRI